MEQLRWATRQPIKDVSATLGALVEEWNLSKSFQERVLRSLRNETPSQQETLYGLISALTNAAQGLPIDDRDEIEVRAGRLLNKAPRLVTF